MTPLTLDQVALGSFEAAAQTPADVVIVVDVFRAFTTAAFALSNGAAKIVMTGDLATARTLRDQGVGRYCMGERKSIRPEGFDFGNSPVEIAGIDFTGETLIQTTSNGTRGVLAALGARRVYAGAFVTADATAAVICGQRPASVAIAAMGDENRAVEDELCALYLRSRLIGAAPDPTATLAAARTLTHRLEDGTLSARDADACLQIGTAPFAIRVRREAGLMVAHAEFPAARNAA